MDRLCLTIPDETYCCWNCSLYCKVHGVTLELYEQHSEDIQLANQYAGNWFERVSATAIAISLAFLLSERIAKELPSAHYLETVNFFLNWNLSVCFILIDSWMFFLFLSPQFWEVTFSAWLSDEERNEESYQLKVEKQQEICRGNYIQVKSNFNQDNGKLIEEKKWF